MATLGQWHYLWWVGLNWLVRIGVEEAGDLTTEEMESALLGEQRRYRTGISGACVKPPDESKQPVTVGVGATPRTRTDEPVKGKTPHARSREPSVSSW